MSVGLFRLGWNEKVIVEGVAGGVALHIGGLVVGWEGGVFGSRCGRGGEGGCGGRRLGDGRRDSGSWLGSWWFE